MWPGLAECLHRHAGRVEDGEGSCGAEEAVEEPRGAQQRDGLLVQVDAGADKQHSGQGRRLELSTNIRTVSQCLENAASRDAFLQNP